MHHNVLAMVVSRLLLRGAPKLLGVLSSVPFRLGRSLWGTLKNHRGYYVLLCACATVVCMFSLSLYLVSRVPRLSYIALCTPRYLIWIARSLQRARSYPRGRAVLTAGRRESRFSAQVRDVRAYGVRMSQPVRRRTSLSMTQRTVEDGRSD